MRLLPLLLVKTKVSQSKNVWFATSLLIRLRWIRRAILTVLSLTTAAPLHTVAASVVKAILLNQNWRCLPLTSNLTTKSLQRYRLLTVEKSRTYRKLKRMVTVLLIG